MNAIVGIDEVGRGCWAGPLVASAVFLKENIIGLDDSKKLSKKQREKLYLEIKNEAYVGVGWVSAQEIDVIGLTEATSKAMRTALNNMLIKYAIADYINTVIIDGNFNYLPELNNVKVVPKADSLFPCVSAASIIAKVERDNYMAKMALKYPAYSFEKHVGYGTAIHSEALKLHGICDLHRQSFKPIKAYL